MREHGHPDPETVDPARTGGAFVSPCRLWGQAFNQQWETKAQKTFVVFSQGIQLGLSGAVASALQDMGAEYFHWAT